MSTWNIINDVTTRRSNAYSNKARHSERNVVSLNDRIVRHDMTGEGKARQDQM